MDEKGFIRYNVKRVRGEVFYVNVTRSDKVFVWDSRYNVKMKVRNWGKCVFSKGWGDLKYSHNRNLKTKEGYKRREEITHWNNK